MALPSGKHQDRLATAILGVSVGPVVEQQPYRLHMALPSGPHQGDQAVDIAGIRASFRYPLFY